MGIRFKMMSGFLIIAMMLAVAGGWSVMELNSLSKSISDILKENYQSINAAQKLRESLEREDSAVLLVLLGKKEEGYKIYYQADSSFRAAYNIVQNNITIEGEADVVQEIGVRYELFTDAVRSISAGVSGDHLDWYFEKIHIHFINIIDKLEELSRMNDTEMYKNALSIQRRSERAVMPGIVAVIAAVIFSLLFTYFINKFIITPIIGITDSINAFAENKVSYTYEVQTEDEIGRLNNAVYKMTHEINSSEE